MPVHQFVALVSPITYKQILAFIEQESDKNEAIAFLARLRDDRLMRMTMLFEQVSRGLDFLRMQIAMGLYKEAFYEREVNLWAGEQSRDYQILSDENIALQAGIDLLLCQLKGG